MMSVSPLSTAVWSENTPVNTVPFTENIWSFCENCPRHGWLLPRPAYS